MATQPRLLDRGFLSLLTTQFLGAANAMSFMACSLAAGLYWGLSGPMGIAANRAFLVCGVLAIVGTVVGTIQLRRLLAGQPEPLLAPLLKMGTGSEPHLLSPDE